MEIADEIDDLDSMPLVKRKRLLLSEKEPPLRHPSVKRVTPAVKQKWPDLPRGVIFDPSDEDLLWHLLAEIGKGEIEPHPLISEFIATLDDNDSFAYCHPYTLPGVKQDGKVSYYFHKSFKAYDMRSRKRKKSLNEDTGLWHQVGKTKPLYMDGIQRGFKRIMVLYMRMARGEKLEKTNWVMHQFSASREDEGGEFVVSKIFYQAKCRPDDGSAVGLPIDIVKYVAGEVGNIVSQKAVRPDFQAGKSSFTSLDVPVQSRYDDIQAEESHPHAGWSEADNNDKFSRNPTEDSKQGENQLQFLLDGQQHGNMLAFGELVNRQSVCALEVETGRPCLSDKAHLGDDDVGKKVDYKAGTSSRSSLDIREDINECVADQVKNECEPIVTQPLHDECYVDTGEHDGAKSSASALIESTETVISGGELGSLIAKAEAQNSVCSTLLVPVKTEPMDQIYVTSVSETNAATEYCSNMSIASLIPSIAPSILEANVCLSDTSSSRYNFHQNNKKDSGHVISEAKQCCLEQVHVNQNVYDPHTSSHVSILPFEVKAELMEELPSLLIAADYPTETSSDFALCSSEVNPQDNNSQDNLLLADRTSVEHASANCSVLNQASDPKDVLSNSNDLQCSTTTSGPLDTVNSESSCIIKCCATKVPIREIDFEARNKLPDLVPSSYPERSKLECVESRLLSADQSSPSILSELDVQRTMVKSEFFEEPATDVIDHIPLIVRMHASGISNSSLANNMESSLQLALPSLGCDSFDSANVKAKCFSLRRKNKKTATDSVETALEEDVPGLLQVLLDRGITVEEIKLYGDAEDDEAIALDSEDSFKDLEAVITKLFSNGPSILKLSMIRPIKGSKAVYCLACLISLIEQTRYLRFRQNPIEWGWCRDLQSFIFVFESHNRIVLERPEYGYATYFFELVATLPIDWQIKRLVTAMKLPFCSRSLLIENKSLLVGEDITEGEARVLEEYGWIRNSGIGSLLNYCDRVVHDKRSETYSSEWRGKIGKMLMRGYDSGRTILCSLPKKVTGKYIGYQNPEQYIGDQNPEQYTDYCNPEIKLEPFVD